ncbi:MAG: hypothetical protein IPK16_19175 [Anaerolineales bacterium]|nr:hypothetical protein [Anaerolineales bacterium]
MNASIDLEIRPLQSDALVLANAGGKAAQLSVLLRAGLPAPAGFVVLTDGYQRFVQANDLAMLIERVWRNTGSGEMTVLEAGSAAIRAGFLAGVIPPDLAQIIRANYWELAGETSPVAVRSSATAEDLPEASFAGQQDTYLNVRGGDDVLHAVVRCWASLWTARAMAYRRRQGIAPHEVALAVVVQKMVQATAAGVLFTINPLTGARHEMVINATWGLGEALVSGRVTPDTLIVDRNSGRIKQIEVGDKAVMTAPVGAGTREIEVDARMRRQAVLETSQVGELVELGKRLEKLFGAPQDIEWALAGGTMVILQSRAVTTAGGVVQAPGDDAWPPVDAGKPIQPFDLWTTNDVGERWPEPVTPLTWSVWEPLIHENMEGALRELKAPYAGQIRWSQRAFGHVYLNEGALFHAYTDGLGMPKTMIAASLSGVIPVQAHESKFDYGKALRHAPFFWRAAVEWERNVARFERDFPQIDRWVDAFMSEDLGRHSDAELWRQFQTTWRERMSRYMAYHANATSLSMSGYTQMENLMAKWMGDRELVQKLTAGLSGVIAAEIVPAMWAMAKSLHALGLAKVVQAHPPAEALAELRSSASAGPFLVLFDAFLLRHGHRCMSEAEYLYPRWVEAPEVVIEMLAGYLAAGDAHHAPNDEGAVRARVETVAAVEAKLNPLQRAYFRRMLARLQRFIRARDNGQHFLVKLGLPMRHILAVLAVRWAQRRWLQQPEQFFFLAASEIEAVIAANGPATAAMDLAATANARRQAYDYWFTQPMPDLLGPDGAPIELRAQSERDADNEVLIGLAASRGLVTGIARVVMSPREAVEMRPGEILVTRATDPGWTPIFSVIGGAVIEIGGMLSHGAIVAREYGLPAVINIPQATQRIRDGQTITVDGTRGRVLLRAESTDAGS